METVSHESSVLAVDRPHRNLLTYYLLGSFVLGPLFFILLIPAYFRYHTLRYRFDDEGVSARWGILFRKEIHLTYARIQDIHLRSNCRVDRRGSAPVRSRPRFPLLQDARNQVPRSTAEPSRANRQTRKRGFGRGRPRRDPARGRE
jgi:hypothetical protein